MPEALTDSDVDSILGIKQTPQQQKARSLANTVTQPSPAATDVSALGPQPITQSRATQTWEQANATPGVPLLRNPPPTLTDTDGKAIRYADEMAMVRLKDQPEDKVSYLEGLFGKGMVRMSNDNRPIVTVASENGKPVEFDFLGQDVTASDVYSTAVSLAPETVGALLGQRAGAAVPTKSKILGTAAEMIGAGIGGQAGAAAKDIAVSSQPIESILSERASEVPSATALNTAMLGAGKVIGKVISPVGGSRTGVEEGLDEASQYFKSKYGVEYPRTMGEQTGSSVLKRLEASLSRHPGSSATFDKLKQEKLAAFRNIQNKMLSSGLDPSDMGMLEKLAEDVGEDAIKALQTRINPLQQAAAIAQDDTAKIAHQSLINELEGAAGPIGKFYPEKVGQSVRSGVFAAKQADKAQVDALYNDVRAAGSEVKNLDLTNLAKEAKGLLKKQASIERTTQVPTGILGPSGQPISRTVTGEEVVREFVPSKVLTSLQEIASWDTAKASLDDLIKVRSSIGDMIEGGQALPGIETKFLKEVQSKINSTIDTELKKLPTSDLKTKFDAANQAYKKYAEKYEPAEIARLFRDVDSGAFVKDENIIKNIGPSQYETYKKFFGANSPEFGNIKRAVLEDVVNDSIPTGSEMINGGAFLKQLDDFVKNRKSVAEDILGKDRIQRLSGLGKVQQLLSETIPLDKAKVTQLLVNPPKDLRKAIDGLVAEQREINKVYRSNILKDIAEGKLGESFNAGEFVDRAYKSSSPAEVGEIVRLLENNPKELDNLRRKVVERMFYEAQGAGEEATRVGKGEVFKTTNTSTLENIIGSEDNKAKLTKLLGRDRMDDFESLAKLLRGGEVAEKTFKGAATFAASAQVNEMMKGGIFGYLSDWAKQKIAAFIYTKPVSAWAGNQVFSGPEGKFRMARTMVASAPFVDAMTEDFGEQNVQKFMDAIYDSIDRYETEGPEGAAALKGQDWVNEILTNKPPQKVFPVN